MNWRRRLSSSLLITKWCAMANKLIVQNNPITVITDKGKDFICLTDMAGAKQNVSRAADVIKNWLRNRYTVEFLDTWEMIHNPDFKVVEFDHFRMQAGLPSFVSVEIMS